MRIKAVKAVQGGWDVIPLSGKLEGEVIGNADGVSLRYVKTCGGEITGEALAVWGLTVTHPMFYNDPKTVRGIGIGRGFDMRSQVELELDSGGRLLTMGGEYVDGAQHLWAMGDKVQAFNPRVTGYN